MKIDPVKDGGPLYTDRHAEGRRRRSQLGRRQEDRPQGRQRLADGRHASRFATRSRRSLELKIAALRSQRDVRASTRPSSSTSSPARKFAYDSKATQQFTPWGFTAVDTKLNAPDLDELDALLAAASRSSATSSTRKVRRLRSASAPRRSRRSSTRPRRSCSRAPTGADHAGRRRSRHRRGRRRLHGGHGAGRRRDEGRGHDRTSSPSSTLTKVFGYSFGTELRHSTPTRRRTRCPLRRSRTRPRSSTSRSRTSTPRPRASTSAHVKAGGSATKTITIENTRREGRRR